MKTLVMNAVCAAIVTSLAVSAAQAAPKAHRRHVTPTTSAAFARMDEPATALSPAQSDAARYYNHLSAPAGH